jgi:hypothetical protein
MLLVLLIGCSALKPEWLIKLRSINSNTQKKRAGQVQYFSEVDVDKVVNPVCLALAEIQ